MKSAEDWHAEYALIRQHFHLDAGDLTLQQYSNLLWRIPKAPDELHARTMQAVASQLRRR